MWRHWGKLLRGDANALSAWAGNYLGPIIRVRRGQRVRIDFVNALPESTIIHWHGLHVPEPMDGHPRYAIAPGGQAGLLRPSGPVPGLPHYLVKA